VDAEEIAEGLGALLIAYSTLGIVTPLCELLGIE
jgi:hypothetical protein